MTWNDSRQTRFNIEKPDMEKRFLFSVAVVAMRQRFAKLAECASLDADYRVAYTDYEMGSGFSTTFVREPRGPA